MEKLYDKQQNLIGYNYNDVCISDKFELFYIECRDIKLKLEALGIPEYNSAQYYIPVIKNMEYKG